MFLYSGSAAAMLAGGQEEADRAYAEAMHAVFTAQVDCHRHSQPFSRKKDGKVRWAMLEMWPMLVGARLNAAQLDFASWVLSLTLSAHRNSQKIATPVAVSCIQLKAQARL